MNNHYDIAKYLIDAGADLNSNYSQIRTVVLDLWTGHYEIVKLLSGLGVDFKTKVKFRGKMMSYNGSPLYRAVETGQLTVIKLIRGNG